MTLLVSSRDPCTCPDTLGQTGLGWFYRDDTGLGMVLTVMTVVAIMAEVLNRDDIIFAMMRMTIQLWLMSGVTMLVETEWMAVMARLDRVQVRWGRRHL